MKKGVIKYAIASDLRRGPLDSAEKTARLYGVTDKVSLRLGSGFETVSEGEADSAAVAGMGGLLIAELLKEKETIVRKIKTLVLQPMTALFELRHFLYSNGYTIDDEVLAKDGEKIYSIMKVHSEKTDIPSLPEIYIGIHILQKNGEVYDEYKSKQIKKLKKQIEGMEKSEKTDKDKLNYTKKLLEDIENIICERN